MYDAHLENRGIGAYQKKLAIHANRLIAREEIDRQLVGIDRYRLVGVEVSKADNRLSISYSVEAGRDTLEALTDRLRETGWFDSCSIE